MWYLYKDNREKIVRGISLFKFKDYILVIIFFVGFYFLNVF